MKHRLKALEKATAPPFNIYVLWKSEGEDVATDQDGIEYSPEAITQLNKQPNTLVLLATWGQNHEV